VNTAVSVGIGGATGLSGTAVNLRVCDDAGYFANNTGQCAELFGPLSGWAASNPVIAAFALGAVAFLLAQGGQWLVGKFMENS
jgi:hypothetical protein